ncbi:endonuclease/exonuclease/phosphatase family protein [Streptosporangium sp. NPDC003464]
MLAVQPAPAQAAVAVRPKIMQFNLAGGEWWKGTKTPAVNAIATTARQVRPDVITLNEICRDQYEALRNMLKPADGNGWQITGWDFHAEADSLKYTRCLGLKGTSEPCYAAGTCHLAVGSAILTRLNASDRKLWDLPGFVRGDGAEYKMLCVKTWLPVEASPARNQYSQVCVTHLDPVGGVVDPARMVGGWSSFCLPKTATWPGEDIRHCQASVIRARLEENMMIPDANGRYAPLLVAGDLNQRLDEVAFTSYPEVQQRAAQVTPGRRYFGFSDFQPPGTVPLKFHYREAGAATDPWTFCSVPGVPTDALPPVDVSCRLDHTPVKLDHVVYQTEYWHTPTGQATTMYRTPGDSSSGLLSDHRRYDAQLTWQPLPPLS